MLRSIYVIMQDEYIAHFREDGSIQSIREHLRGTAMLASSYAASFGQSSQAWLAAMTHDIGKYSEAFQRRIRGAQEQVDHSTAGAVECTKRAQIYCAFAVAGHHGGLPDGGQQTDPTSSATFLGRMNRARLGKLEPYSQWEKEINLEAVPPLARNQERASEMFFTRMLFSCLVDADYLDTERFMSGSERTKGSQTMEKLWEKLLEYIGPWFPPHGELNRQRCEILKHCMEAGEKEGRGLFTLTVPTGGGKTVASLAFALAQAKSKGLSRIIYVIPYTSIIEQTADTFRKILGEENVLEHHSNVLYDIENEADPKNIQLAKATENWDMPVIVTTSVQFFESLYSYKPSQCRKLHNIANSVIIFDEAQMLSLAYLRPCVYAISQLVKDYRASAVLCTATQPALEKIFKEFLPEHTASELCPKELINTETFRRTSFSKAGRLSWDELACRMNGLDQVLCIVNSRSGAQELYSRLQGQGVYHLSTLMCPCHRREKLREIRQRLAAAEICRVVSTSLIEAGVDVDFPAVFREEAGLDSILQAAGRCNREGKRNCKDSLLTVFQGEGKTPPLFATAIGAARQTMRQFEDFSCPEAIHNYFTELLDLKGPEAQDLQNILKIMEDGLFPFRTVAERFHLIDSAAKTVYVPYKDGDNLVVRLKHGERSKDLFRALGQYSVSVYPQHFSALEHSGDICLLEDGSAVLGNMALYSENTGLSLKADEGKALFI